MVYEMSKCTLSEELVTLLSKPHFYDSFKLVIIPQINNDQNNFEVFQEGNQIEIICYKSTFISIFKENHMFMEKYLPDMNLDTFIKNNSKFNYIDLYNATVGLLLTTAENKTNFNLHSAIFFTIWNSINSENEKFDFLLKETFIVQRLLTCSLNKINKSSSLFIWYRKLFILWQYNHKQYHNNNNIIEKLMFTSKVFIQSGKQHFGNYYNWNTAKWVFDNLNNVAWKQTFFNDVKQFCFQNVSDSSSWDCLSYMVCQYKLKSHHYILDFNRLAKSLPNSKHLLTRHTIWFQTDLIELVQGLISYISKCEIKAWPPYLCLLRILKVYNTKINDLSLEILNDWRQSINSFESKNGEIQLLNDFIPVVPSDQGSNSLNDDYITRETLFHLGYKKAFLNKLTNSRYSIH